MEDGLNLMKSKLARVMKGRGEGVGDVRAKDRLGW